MGKVSFLLASFIIFCSKLAFANYPVPWQIDFQDPATPSAEKFLHLQHHLHNIMFVIVVLVTALLIYVCYKFSAKRNPVPSKTSHNTLIEAIWTFIPIVILVSIAVPSLRVLYFIDQTPKSDFTLKVVGHQWYWSYEYPDHGNFGFDSYIIPEDKLQPGDKRLLEVDNKVVVPVGATVKVLVTSADVIHGFAISSLGVKIDAVPGRTNETWFQITKPGIYYGQCMELCGVGHGFMPIVIEAVSTDDFNKWVGDAKKKFASN